MSDMQKCIVSGCEIPARAAISGKVLAESWRTCGVHRKPLADMLNAAGNEYIKLVSQAGREKYSAIINGLDKLGNHEDELALAVGKAVDEVDRLKQENLDLRAELDGCRKKNKELDPDFCEGAE